MVNPYLKRRQGREPVESLHPSLEPILARTLGVPLFQEQLLRMAMVAAGFSGGEAEDLRRAFGFKRSEKRMKDVEQKLRRGMARNGIPTAAQEKIILSITSFALYGFPESHAASFALIAYASAYLKCHYLAAFTAAMLNNQPMGFYQPATLVKDAQRHGLRVKPIDATCSKWLCTLEAHDEGFHMRLGLRYVRGLRQEAGEALVQERVCGAFASIDDLKLRVPALRTAELRALADVGALNFIQGRDGFHRRDALWQVERAARDAGPLLEGIEERCGAEGAEGAEGSDAADEFTSASASASETSTRPKSPLLPMTVEERLVADFQGTGLTIGKHPMGYHREKLKSAGVRTAHELQKMRHGSHVRVAGAVICRQRPGTAKGFVFLSLEDETGVANAILTPDLFDTYHVTIVHKPFLLLDGMLQNQDGVISVKVERLEALTISRAETTSHDFH
jgi:error-prone DNA polymerase